MIGQNHETLQKGERWGSNPRMEVPQTSALTTWLRSPLTKIYYNITHVVSSTVSVKFSKIFVAEAVRRFSRLLQSILN